jgi:hypothetical protein
MQSWVYSSADHQAANVKIWRLTSVFHRFQAVFEPFFDRLFKRQNSVRERETA